jgi:hypothetical protein
MGIYKQGKIYWVSKCINGIQYRQTAGTDKKMEAVAFYERWTAELRERVKNGKPIKQERQEERQEPEQITFAELSSKSLEFIAGRLRSYERLKSFIKKLNGYFSNKRLTDFTVLDIENMQSDILNNNLSVAYANRLTAILKRMFTKAAD